MDKFEYYQLIENHLGTTDYEQYLNTYELLKCQKKLDAVLPDELQFQIVHQSEELWMKLLNYTLVEVAEYIIENNFPRIVTLFKRIHKIQKFLIEQLSMLETMATKEYFPIRELLGKGSGQESPGFKSLIRITPMVWQEFERHYLLSRKLSIKDIYDEQYKHSEEFVIAEFFIEYDALFQQFLYGHLRLVERTIGPQSHSLKGRSTDALIKSASRNFFPELWNVRTKMTEQSAQSYSN